MPAKLTEDRAVNLGVAGEHVYGGLVLEIDWSPRTNWVRVRSPHAAALDEVARRLANRFTPLVKLEVGAQLRERISAAVAAGARVLWLSGTSQGWIEGLGDVNASRDALGVGRAVAFVLAGGDEVDHALTRRGLDIKSMLKMAIFEEPPAVLMQVPEDVELRFVHLSDLHVKDHGFALGERLTRLQALLPAMWKESFLEGPPHLLAVTGDLAYSGKALEYERVYDLLAGLREALDNPRIVLVPGNHDIDRAALKTGLALRVRRSLPVRETALREALSDLSDDAESVAAAAAPLEAFSAFSARLLGAGLGWTTARPWRADVVEVDGVRVGILGVNTAWLCGPEDQDLVRVGERQVAWLIDQVADCPVRLALMHHPPKRITASCEAQVQRRLEEGVQLVLSGHVHDAGARLSVSGSRAVAWLAGPALFDDGNPAGLWLGGMGLGTGALRVRQYGWVGKGEGRWVVSNEGVGATDGWSKLALAVEGVSTASGDVGLQLRRLAAAAAEAAGRVDLIGMPADAAGRARKTDVVSIFAPLCLSEARTPLVLGDLVTRLEGARKGGTVVLGGPGTGKTTLLRWLAQKVASAGRLPVLVLLREMGDADDLWSHAAARLGELAGERVTERVLRDGVAGGQAVLLVDGLDEVIGERRARIRDAVAGAARTGVVIATSRILGYEEAPLPPKAFVRVDIEPLDDPALRELAERWVAAVEDDPSQRATRALSLLAAMDAEPSAKALARVPLLAVLVALVHHREAQLPGERAELYRLVVDLLVVKWPRMRRELPPVPPEEQIVLLERVALFMQEGRTEEKAVTLTRSSLLGLVDNDVRDDAAAVNRRHGLVDWWARSSGVLVELQPGWFGWIHLSVGEYLAGCALLRRERAKGGDGAVVSALKERAEHPHWHETILLLLGAAKGEELLHRAAFDALTDVELRARMVREELGLSPEQVKTAVDGVLRAAWPWATPGRDALRVVVSLGKRHRAGVIDRIRHAAGDVAQLPGVDAVADDVVLPNSWLHGRPDRHVLIPRALLFPGRVGDLCRAAATQSERWLASGHTPPDQAMALLLAGFSWPGTAAVRAALCRVSRVGRALFPPAVRLGDGLPSLWMVPAATTAGRGAERWPEVGRRARAFSRDFSRAFSPLPAAEATGAQNDPWAEPQGQQSAEAARAAADRLMAQQVGAAWVGLVSSRAAGLSMQEVEVSVASAVQDAEYVQLGAEWVAYEQRSSPLPSARRATHLALGLSAFCTTHAWPGPAWEALMTPDEDPLVGYVQALIRGLRDPERIDSHLDAARASLERLNDPEVIEGLWEVRVVPLTPEQRANYDINHWPIVPVKPSDG